MFKAENEESSRIFIQRNQISSWVFFIKSNLTYFYNTDNCFQQSIASTYRAIRKQSAFSNKRLNTRMAPTCDWMIKIVKVDKLYLNSLLVSIVNRVSQSGTMTYQCESKYRCVKQEMVTYVAKGRQPFLFSEVVQRYSGDEKVIC